MEEKEIEKHIHYDTKFVNSNCINDSTPFNITLI